MRAKKCSVDFIELTIVLFQRYIRIHGYRHDFHIFIYLFFSFLLLFDCCLSSEYIFLVKTSDDFSFFSAHRIDSERQVLKFNITAYNIEVQLMEIMVTPNR